MGCCFSKPNQKSPPQVQAQKDNGELQVKTVNGTTDNGNEAGPAQSPNRYVPDPTTPGASQPSSPVASPTDVTLTPGRGTFVFLLS